jgi:hypothetical protein
VMMQRDREHNADADCGQKPGRFEVSRAHTIVTLTLTLPCNRVSKCSDVERPLHLLGACF